jgi:hypothetical protein
MEIKKTYRIKRMKDDLFSTGGCNPRFSKSGKTWTQIGHLKNHLNLFNSDEIEKFYGDCILIAYKEEPIRIIGMDKLSVENRNDILEEFRIRRPNFE